MKKCYTLLCIGLCAAAFSARAQTQFQDVSSLCGIDMTSGSDGIYVQDFNNDGWEDVYVNFQFRPNQLYKNLGNGTFVEMAAEAGVAVDSLSAAAVWGDINNDGLADLYVARRDRQDQLFLNNGDETFTDIAQSAGITNVGHPFSANMADINNDGFLDIYVTNFLLENVMYRNNGDNTFADVTQQAKAFDTGLSMGTVFFDYDKDGDADLYLVHDGNNPNFLYQNNGAGVFADVSFISKTNTSSQAMGVDVGDINNDGFPDIYITNLFHNILLKNNGDGTFANISQSAGIEDNGMGWGVSFLDYNNDGLLDVYVANDHNFSPYPNVLYQNTGNETFVKAETGGPVSNTMVSFGAACLDFNHDGNQDIWVANRATGEYPQLLQNAPRDGNWLGLKLIGIQSNRSAVGARVTLRDNQGRLLCREVVAGHGWKSQHSGILHFGLGAAQSLLSFEIEWPSGLKQTLPPVAPNGFYTVFEGQDAQAGLLAFTGTQQAGAVQGFSFTVFPNPATSGAFQATAFLNEPSDVVIDLFRADGRLLYTRRLGKHPAGEQTFRLDLPEGLRHGMVVVRLTTAQGSLTRKLLIADQSR